MARTLSPNRIFCPYYTRPGPLGKSRFSFARAEAAGYKEAQQHASEKDHRKQSRFRRFGPGKLFPGESARANYEESLAEASLYEYYLIYEGADCAGIIGLYRYPEDPDSAWLGWFGIRAGFRRRRLGSAALKRFEDMAGARGYRFARLYTDELHNETAIAFYKANGYLCERYRNMEDPACLQYKTLIFSKPLTGDALTFFALSHVKIWVLF